MFQILKLTLFLASIAIVASVDLKIGKNAVFKFSESTQNELNCTNETPSDDNHCDSSASGQGNLEDWESLQIDGTLEFAQTNANFTFLEGSSVTIGSSASFKSETEVNFLMKSDTTFDVGESLEMSSHSRVWFRLDTFATLRSGGPISFSAFNSVSPTIYGHVISKGSVELSGTNGQIHIKMKAENAGLFIGYPHSKNLSNDATSDLIASAHRVHIDMRDNLTALSVKGDMKLDASKQVLLELGYLCVEGKLDITCDADIDIKFVNKEVIANVGGFFVNGETPVNGNWSQIVVKENVVCPEIPVTKVLTKTRRVNSSSLSEINHYLVILVSMMFLVTI